MMSAPMTGTEVQQKFQVESAHTISFDGMPAVLATPFLIGFLERAARACLAPFLNKGDSSVGVHIELDHLAPAGLGSTVTCTARVVQSEGRAVAFQLEAAVDGERIARGYHKRRVVTVSRFVKKIEALKK